MQSLIHPPNNPSRSPRPLRRKCLKPASSPPADRRKFFPSSSKKTTTKKRSSCCGYSKFQIYRQKKILQTELWGVLGLLIYLIYLMYLINRKYLTSPYTLAPNTAVFVFLIMTLLFSNPPSPARSFSKSFPGFVARCAPRRAFFTPKKGHPVGNLLAKKVRPRAKPQQLEDVF